MNQVVRRGSRWDAWSLSLSRNFKLSAHVAHTDGESLCNVVYSPTLFSLAAVIVQLVLLVMLHVGLPVTFHPHGG